jgi:hypothetical protein
VLQNLQEGLQLLLLTGLLCYEARQAGHAVKADAFDCFLTLVIGGSGLWLQAQGPHVRRADAEHLRSVISTTSRLVTAPQKLPRLLGLLAQQQPSIFRAAAGQGQRAAVLDPLLACLHLQCVVYTLLCPGPLGYAMHFAARNLAVAQLRVLQGLGADLSMMYISASGMGMTPLIEACNSQINKGTYASGLQQAQHLELFQQHGKDREAAVLTGDGSYTPCVKLVLEAVKVLVDGGADVAARQPGRGTTVLTAAGASGMWPVEEYLIPLAMKASQEKADSPPEQHVLFTGILTAAGAGHARCLHLLVAAAGGPTADVCVAALCRTASRSLPLALQLLLAEGVPINGQLGAVGTPLHAFLQAPSQASMVGTAPMAKLPGTLVCMSPMLLLQYMWSEKAIPCP